MLLSTAVSLVDRGSNVVTLVIDSVAVPGDVDSGVVPTEDRQFRPVDCERADEWSI